MSNKTAVVLRVAEEVPASRVACSNKEQQCSSRLGGPHSYGRRDEHPRKGSSALAVHHEESSSRPWWFALLLVGHQVCVSTKHCRGDGCELRQGEGPDRELSSHCLLLQAVKMSHLFVHRMFCVGSVGVCRSQAFVLYQRCCDSRRRSIQQANFLNEFDLLPPDLTAIFYCGTHTCQHASACSDRRYACSFVFSVVQKGLLFLEERPVVTRFWLSPCSTWGHCSY